MPVSQTRPDDTVIVVGREDSDTCSKPLSKRKIASAPAAPAYKGAVLLNNDHTMLK